MSVETRLKQYRLSGVVVEAAEKPFSSDAAIAGDGDAYGNDKGSLLSVTAKMIRSSFKQPGDKGYESASAVQVRCKVDALKAGSEQFYITNPAQFAATFTLVDPNTESNIFSSHYSKEVNVNGGDSSSGCINTSIGRNSFQSAVRDVVIQLSNGVPAATKLVQQPREAAVDGTLEYAEGLLPLTTTNLTVIFANAKYNAINTRTISRIAEIDIPNRIQSTIDRAKLFTNSTKASYKIVSYVTRFYYNAGGILSSGIISYKADAVIFKNGKEIGNIVFVSRRVPLDQQDAELDRQADTVVDFIKKNANQWNRDEVKDEKVLIHAGRDVHSSRVRKAL